MADNSLVTANMTAAEVMDSWVTEQYRFRPTTILVMYCSIAMLGLLGVVGNVVSMVVWTRPQVKSSSSVLLTALAACDLLILISTNPYTYLRMLTLSYHDSPAIVYMDKFISPYVAVWLDPVYFTAQTASIYLTLTITLQRYIAVSRPFQARLDRSCSRACKYAAAVITVAILINLVACLRFKVVARLDDNGEIMSCRTEVTELGQSPLLRSISELYYTWLRLILVYLLPFICIAVLNTLIYLEVKKVEKLRQTLTVSQKRENRMTMMLVHVVAEFLVCSSVGLLFITAFEVFDLSDEQLGFKMSSLAPLYTFLDTFNSSSNFVAYFVFGSGFREALFSTFSCCRGLRRLRRPYGTDDQELDVRTSEISTCQSTAGNETTDLQV